MVWKISSRIVYNFYKWINLNHTPIRLNSPPTAMLFAPPTEVTPLVKLSIRWHVPRECACVDAEKDQADSIIMLHEFINIHVDFLFLIFLHISRLLEMC